MTKTDTRISRPWSRVGDLFVYGLGQLRTIKKIYPGIMHLLIFWGVIIQVIGTAIKILQMGLFFPYTWPVFSQNVYLGYELVLDLAGVAILLGVLMAIIRRWIIKPRFMENSWDDFYALILLTLIPTVGFITEGFRLYSLQPSWANWSPIGNFTASIISNFSISPGTADLIHPYLFWCHVSL